MPAPIPQRTRDVYFLGAGFSRALGLPNTAELLFEVHRLAQSQRPALAIDRKLREAYQYFYPEEARGFVPDVVDFFSVLRAYEDVAVQPDGTARFPGGFKYPALLTELRLIVVRLLCDRLRQIQIPPEGWPGIEQMLRPGNVIITSNWDTFIEWYAHCRRIRLRLGGWPEDATLTLLKLHGSVDWTEQTNRKASYADDDYAVLRELQNTRPYPIKIKQGDVLRVRAVENMSKSWQFIKARTARPHMIMMSQGKTTDLAPIQSMWDDAYTALCAARELTIIGYSLPHDDVEIRTLLRAGVSRGSVHPRVIVQNPEPGTHVRVRTYVLRDAESDYRAFSPG
jgi:hypothetical protein